MAPRRGLVGMNLTAEDTLARGGRALPVLAEQG